MSEDVKESSFMLYLQHIALAIYLSATAMALVIERPNIYIYTNIVGLVVFLISTRLNTIKNISYVNILGAFICCGLFAISSVSIEKSAGQEVIKTYFQFYVIAGIGSLLVSSYSYDFETFIKAFILLGLIFAPKIVTTNYSTLEYEVDNDEWMSKVYAIMPYIIASLYYLFEGEKKLFKVLSVVCILSYSTMVILHTPRGAIVAMFLSFIVFLYQKATNKGVNILIILIVILLIVVLLYVFWNLIFNWLQTVADDRQLRWLQKFVDTDDISNNRSSLYSDAINGFVSKPLFGHGIASFHDYERYPHNLFLEMMYETGILMLIPMAVYIFIAISIILRCDNKIDVDYRIITFLFLNSFVQLMFSSFFWRNTCFWMLIWIMMRIIHSKLQKEN